MSHKYVCRVLAALGLLLAVIGRSHAEPDQEPGTLVVELKTAGKDRANDPTGRWWSRCRSSRKTTLCLRGRAPVSSVSSTSRAVPRSSCPRAPTRCASWIPAGCRSRRGPTSRSRSRSPAGRGRVASFARFPFIGRRSCPERRQRRAFGHRALAARVTTPARAGAAAGGRRSGGRALLDPYGVRGLSVPHGPGAPSGRSAAQARRRRDGLPAQGAPSATLAPRGRSPRRCRCPGDLRGPSGSLRGPPFDALPAGTAWLCCVAIPPKRMAAMPIVVPRRGGESTVSAAALVWRSERWAVSGDLGAGSAASFGKGRRGTQPGAARACRAPSSDR